MKKLHILYGLLMGMAIVAGMTGFAAGQLWPDLTKAAMASVPETAIHVLTPCEAGSLRIARLLSTVERVAYLFAFLSAISAFIVAHRFRKE
jgi:hypothetical protein